MNLLFAIDHNYTSLRCTCMRSIMKNGGEAQYDAYILHSDLTAADQQTICQTSENTITRHFIQVEDKKPGCEEGSCAQGI